MSAPVTILTQGVTVRVRYKNWRGVTSDRTLKIMSVPVYMASQWHPEPQWMIWAIDQERPEDERRAYALKDMEPA